LRSLAIALLIVIAVIVVLSPLVLFLLVLVRVVISTGLDICVRICVWIRSNISFSLSIHSAGDGILVLLVLLFVLVLVDVGFLRFVAGICSCRRLRSIFRDRCIASRRFGFSLFTSFVVRLLLVFVRGVVATAIGCTSAASDTQHALKGRRGLVDFLIFRHSQMTAFLFVVGF